MLAIEVRREQWSRLARQIVADHDHVRVLAQNRAQGIGEGQVDTWLYLDLVDAFELVFDGVLDGKDFLFRGVQLLQCGIQGR